MKLNHLSMSWACVHLAVRACTCVCCCTCVHTQGNARRQHQVLFLQRHHFLVLWDWLSHWDPWLMDYARLAGQWAPGIYSGESAASHCWGDKHMLPQPDGFQNMGSWHSSWIFMRVQQTLGKLRWYPGHISHSVSLGFLKKLNPQKVHMLNRDY